MSKSIKTLSSSDYDSYIQTYNFITENPTWSLKSLCDYCMKYFNVSPDNFSSACKTYIDMTKVANLMEIKS
jgi:hypothetical protein